MASALIDSLHLLHAALVNANAASYRFALVASHKSHLERNTRLVSPPPHCSALP